MIKEEAIKKINAIKWIPAKHEYEPYDLPDGSTCYEQDLAKVVRCAQCGRALLYGDAYTSLEVHSQIGFGYAVCYECYEAEYERRKEAYYETIGVRIITALIRLEEVKKWKKQKNMTVAWTACM